MSEPDPQIGPGGERPTREMIVAEVVRTLALSQLPEDVRPASVDGSLTDIAIPAVVRQGIAQSGYSVPDVLAKTLALEVTIKYLERELDHTREAAQRAHDEQMTDGKVIMLVLTVVGILVAITAAIAGILVLVT